MKNKNYKYKNEVYKITLVSTLTGLAILLGAFAKIPIFGDRHVFLMGSIVLIMPIFLDFKYTIIGTTIAVVITDLLNGWIAFAWISFFAYSFGIAFLHFLTNVYKFKRKTNNFLVYILSVTIASFIMTFIYVFFTWFVWGSAMALKELLTDIIQFSIISLISISMYKFVIKLNKIIF